MSKSVSYNAICRNNEIFALIVVLKLCKLIAQNSKYGCFEQ